MGYFAFIVFLFILASLGIYVYFTHTPEGRKQDVSSSLEEANLQNKLVDTIEETREVQKELHERVESLRN